MLPLDDEHWPESLSDLREGFAGKLNIYRVMAHNPELLRAWAPLRRHVVLESDLTEEQKEIVILRAGHRWGSPYEWAHHVHRGGRAGLSPERIARAAAPPGDWGSGEPEDVALLQATDALLDTGRLDPGRIETLREFLSDAAIIDLMATIGMYTTLAFLANSFEVPIDEEVAGHAA